MLSDESGRELTEAIGELSSQVFRLSRVIEGRDTPAETPIAIHFDDNGDFTAPRMPRNLSWHQKLRGKKVSLPAATGTSLLIYGLAELIRIIIGYVR